MSQRHSRLQSIFQNFYGLGLPDTDAKSAQDKYNIDGPCYSAEDDFKREVKKSDLQGLRKRITDQESSLII